MKAKIYQIDFCPAEWNDWCVIFLFQKFVLEMKSRCGEVLAELENSKELEVRWKFPKTIILLSLKKKQSNRNDIKSKKNFIQSGASSQAKHGGAYFSAVYGSIEDPLLFCPSHMHSYRSSMGIPAGFVLKQVSCICLVTNTLDLFQNKSCCNASISPFSPSNNNNKKIG